LRLVRRGERLVAVVLAAGLVGAVGGCSDDDAPTTSGSPTPVATSEETPVALPDGALRELVPAPDEVPEGLVPLLQASGPRDADAVAAFSSDPAAAQQALAAHGFRAAYVAQYASPSDPRSLTVLAARFADDAGAQADFEGDVAVSAGDAVETGATIGDASDVRRVALPDDAANELVTVRFRSGPTTWLLAWRAPRPADESIPLEVARELATRG
jgi:hypothetical protein